VEGKEERNGRTERSGEMQWRRRKKALPLIGVNKMFSLLSHSHVWDLFLF